MVYLPLIPAAGDVPSTSQGQIQQNFTQLNDQFKVEHTAFDAATNNGKHKFVTLPRSAGVPPLGTDVVLAQANTVAGNPYFQYISSTQIYSVPTCVSVTGVIANGTHSIYNFATLPMIPQMGTVFMMDLATGSQQVFTMFSWIGGVLNIPFGPTNQLSKGSDLLTFASGGSTLRVTNSSGGNINFMLKITGSSI